MSLRSSECGHEHFGMQRKQRIHDTPDHHSHTHKMCMRFTQERVLTPFGEQYTHHHGFARPNPNPRMIVILGCCVTESLAHTHRSSRPSPSSKQHDHDTNT
mmetsp:Transcript_5438/g.20312  ORF Transcript_5438/g.20312 Transcript_5438/m.20312 type:complete len:101 (+) Transcript_5438:541-843(+)